MPHRLTTNAARPRCLLVVLATSAVGWLVLMPVGEARAADRAGNAVVVDPSDRSKVLTSGESTTAFALALPRGAACPGDAANDDYRLDTFIVPVGQDPGPDMRFSGYGPEGDLTDANWFLRMTDTVPFVQMPTIANDTKGQPGVVPLLPPFSFEAFTPAQLPPGRYRMGIACTYWWDTERFWDTQIEFASTPGAQPGQLRWEVVDPPETAPSIGAPQDPFRRWVLFGSVALALIGVVLVMSAVNDRRKTPLPKEHS